MPSAEPTPRDHVAVISDVHSNLFALSAVLDSIKAAGIQRIWCLGDTVGYAAHPAECLHLVRESCELVIAGNHDVAAAGGISGHVFAGSARAGIEWTLAQLSAEDLAYLASLSSASIAREVECYHASARDPVWEYVRDENVAAAHLSMQRAPVSLIGHSHVALAYSAPAAATTVWPSDVTGGATSGGTQLSIEGRKVVLNPGSVGQPRDRDPRAAYAILQPARADAASGKHSTFANITYVRVDYDIEAARAAIHDAGLPAESGDRLALGW